MKEGDTVAVGDALGTVGELPAESAMENACASGVPGGRRLCGPGGIFRPGRIRLRTNGGARTEDPLSARRVLLRAAFEARMRGIPLNARPFYDILYLAYSMRTGLLRNEKQERTVLVYEQIQFYRNRDPRRDHHRTLRCSATAGVILWETYQAEEFAAAGIPGPFVQDNQSKSTRGVLRGLHFQKEHTQGKLVRVVSGEVFDVAVDCRPNSETFGKWVGVTLSAENKKQFYIPQGFAHGFLVLSEEAEFTLQMHRLLRPRGRGRREVG